MAFTSPHIGLCACCEHARTLPHPRGGPSYWLCERGATDPSYSRYPRLPVGRCRGFEATAAAEAAPTDITTE